MFESIFVCYVVVRVLWYVLCFTYNKKKKKKKKKTRMLVHMEVVEWSARLARKRAFRVRRLPAPLSMMHILLKYIKKKKKKKQECWSSGQRIWL